MQTLTVYQLLKQNSKGFFIDYCHHRKPRLEKELIELRDKYHSAENKQDLINRAKEIKEELNIIEELLPTESSGDHSES